MAKRVRYYDPERAKRFDDRQAFIKAEDAGIIPSFGQMLVGAEKKKEREQFLKEAFFALVGVLGGFDKVEKLLEGRYGERRAKAITEVIKSYF